MAGRRGLGWRAGRRNGLVSVAIARPGSQWPLIEVIRPSPLTV